RVLFRSGVAPYITRSAFSDRTVLYSLYVWLNARTPMTPLGTELAGSLRIYNSWPKELLARNSPIRHKKVLSSEDNMQHLFTIRRVGDRQLFLPFRALLLRKKMFIDKLQFNLSNGVHTSREIKPSVRS